MTAFKTENFFIPGRGALNVTHRESYMIDAFQTEHHAADCGAASRETRLLTTDFKLPQTTEPVALPSLSYGARQESRNRPSQIACSRNPSSKPTRSSAGVS